MATDVDAHVTTLRHWLEASAGNGASGAARDAGAARAVRALAAMGPEAETAVAVLVRVAHADPRGLGELVGHALGEIGGELAVRGLNSAWFSGWDRKLCDACYGALVRLGVHAQPALLRIAAEPDAHARVKALFSLRATGYSEAALARLAGAMVGDAPMPLIDPLVEFLGGFADANAAAAVIDRLRGIASDDLQFADTRRRAADAMTRLQSRQPPADVTGPSAGAAGRRRA